MAAGYNADPAPGTVIGPLTFGAAAQPFGAAATRSVALWRGSIVKFLAMRIKCQTGLEVS